MSSLINRVINVIKREGLSTFIAKFFKIIAHVFSAPYFILLSKLFYGHQRDLKNLIFFASNSCNKILEVSQEPTEIFSFLEFIKKRERNINVCMEIGTAKGGTLFLLSRIISANGILISIDLPYGKFGGGYFFWRTLLYKAFVTFKQKMVLIRNDSHKPSVRQKVFNVLCNRKIDILFIDGDHTYNGVKQDFEDYSLFVNDNGLIAFHDIAVHGVEAGEAYGVHKFWQEIKNKYPYKEFCFNNGPGIGVIEYSSFNTMHNLLK